MSEEQYKFTKQDCIGCREYCELEKENKELKKINASLQSALSLSRQKYNNDKQRYRRKYKKKHNILTEFEKWLEKLNGNGEVLLPREGLEKLQKLKEGKK